MYLDAIHIISHGSQGELAFANGKLSNANLSSYQAQLEQIGALLSKDGELFIYGCEVAQGQSGRAFVQALREITGLRIAAASHKVGHVDLGGSWELDVAPAMMQSALQVSEWRGVLVTDEPTVTFSGSTLTLTFSSNLKSENVASMYLFTVSVDGENVNLANITPVKIENRKLILTLENPIASNATVKVTYDTSMAQIMIDAIQLKFEDDQWVYDFKDVQASMPLPQAPIIGGIDSADDIYVKLNDKDYLDSAETYAFVTDSDSANFNGGHVLISYKTGAKDGQFLFDSANELIKVGSNLTTIQNAIDPSTYDGSFTAGDKVFWHDGSVWVEVGTIDVTKNGQNGADLQINLNDKAVPGTGLGNDGGTVGDILRYVMFKSSTPGDRKFEVVVNDGSVDSTPATMNVAVGLVSFVYDGTTPANNSANGVASETALGNTVDVSNIDLFFSAGVNDGAEAKVYAIGGGSGVSNAAAQLEYFSVVSQNTIFSLKQFKVYNASGSNITLTITGHAKSDVSDAGLATNAALKTTTATAVNGQWTTIDLPADFGDYKGFRIDSGSGDSTKALYFNDFAAVAAPTTFDLNGIDGDGVNFAATTAAGTGVLLADTDVIAVNLPNNSIGLKIATNQLKAGDKLVISGTDGAQDVEIDLNATVPNLSITLPNSLGDAIFIDATTGESINNAYAGSVLVGFMVENPSSLLTSRLKFVGSEAGDRTFSFLHNDTLETLATTTVTVEAVAAGLTNVTASLNFTENALQTTPQLLDSDVTLNYDNSKLTKIDATHFAKLDVLFVNGTDQLVQMSNNKLMLPDNGTIRTGYNTLNGYEIYYKADANTPESLIGYYNKLLTGLRFFFNASANPTATVIEKIIESITYTVTDFPTEVSKLKITLTDNTGATAEPVYVDVNVTAENDAPFVNVANGVVVTNTAGSWDAIYDGFELSDGKILAWG